MGSLRVSCVLVLAVPLLGACGAQQAAGPLPVQRPAAVPAAAQRMDPSTSCGIPGLRDKVLAEVNAARASGRSCGARRMQPAPPLAWNDALSSAAAKHSADMARRDYFQHASPEGQRIGARALAEGYRWRTVGENIAGGDRSVETVMRGWILSEGHCRNIMSPEFSDIGAACVERAGSTWGTYWTMVLGHPR